jgi:hypothetical protein
MTNTLTITAAYVWQCASDFRANADIADAARIEAGDKDMSVVLGHDDLTSLLAAAAMMDDPDFRSHLYEPGRHIVAARGTRRGVYVVAQSTFPNPDIALNALRAGGR